MGSMRDFPESDWKLLRQLHPLALDRFCQRVLSEVAQLASDAKANPHERYLAVLDFVNRRNDELADAFDDMRRSTATLRLARIRTHSLLTDEEFCRFSAATREAVELPGFLPASVQEAWQAPDAESGTTLDRGHGEDFRV
jgi:hypothetical protein